MTRPLFTLPALGFGLMLGAALPVQAFDMTAMSEAERAAFRDEVKAYLMENPEVLFEAIQVLEDRQKAAEAESDLKLVADNKAALMQDPSDWVGGNPQGDITVVEFLDYRCGYCRKAWQEVEELVNSDGNIRFIIKEFPILGEQSMLSAQFALAVRQIGGDAAYKKAHDALLTLRGDATPETLGSLAQDLGLDAQAVLARMNSPEVKSVIDANHALGSKMQINGTPSFVVETSMLRGYVPLEGMRQLVAQEREG
ncbi:DsbA family protein [Gemmobacter serpentinus]|uniref:DsbA family protein n=1 Tax=Gemmobacter serpentinus TaxID=2652247 RepID=UPI001CF62721|nr:DsbA family protein [Gemmobacter serpentinus]